MRFALQSALLGVLILISASTAQAEGIQVDVNFGRSRMFIQAAGTPMMGGGSVTYGPAYGPAFRQALKVTSVVVNSSSVELTGTMAVSGSNAVLPWSLVVTRGLSAAQWTVNPGTPRASRLTGQANVVITP